MRCIGAAEEQLTTGMTSVFALSKMCIAHMEHRVASGVLDDKPLVALDFAPCVQRYKLLEDAYANQLKVDPLAGFGQSPPDETSGSARVAAGDELRAGSAQRVCLGRGGRAERPCADRSISALRPLANVDLHPPVLRAPRIRAVVRDRLA
jgi:hypothetical protein